MGTGSGAKLEIYNTRERLVSTDHNREQAFGAQALAELFRNLLDPTINRDLVGVTAGSSASEVVGTGTEASLRGHVFNGLQFQPQLGTSQLNAFVSPGTCLLVDNPSPGTDDSISSFVVDPGVQTNGVLTLTPSPSSTRIDVVEVQRITSILESDNRDVFNPATGLFTPTLVAKVQAGRLAYRIRTGTPGAGFPGVAAGWMPIAVCSVPSGATGWDAVTVWDVRPLVSDRSDGGPFATTRLVPWNRRSLAYCDALSSSGHPHIFAEVDLDFGGYRAGGVIATDSSHDYVDPANTALQAPGFSLSSGQLWHLYLVFPFGLPRWVRYTDPVAGVRQPGFQRGVPVVSTTVSGFNGVPLVGVATPTSTGLLDSPGFNAVMAYCGQATTASGFAPLGMHCDGKLWTFVNAPNGGLNNSLTAATSSTTTVTWNLNTSGSGVTVPGNARALKVVVEASIVYGTLAPAAVTFPTVTKSFNITDPFGTTGNIAHISDEGDLDSYFFANPTGSGFSPAAIIRFSLRVPLQPFTWLNQLNPDFWVLTWFHNSGVVLTSPTLTIVGWELGP